MLHILDAKAWRPLRSPIVQSDLGLYAVRAHAEIDTSDGSSGVFVTHGRECVILPRAAVAESLQG